MTLRLPMAIGPSGPKGDTGAMGAQGAKGERGDGGGSIPTGFVLPYAGAGAPVGFLLCDGASVNRVVYADLFGVLGTTYGAGDGAATFNVPDLRGRFPVGVGTVSGLTTRTLGAKGGEESHLLTVAELPSHQHSTAIDTSSGTNIDILRSDRGISAYSGFAKTTAIGGDTPHNNLPPFLGLNFVIKA